MTSFDVLISLEELCSLLDSNKVLSLNDRFRIDSYTYKTLLSDLGSGFSQSELQEVYQLESNNLKKLINCALLYFTDVQNREKISQKTFLFNTKNTIPFQIPNKKEHEAKYFSIFMKYCLSDFNDNLTVKFDGTIPKKLFSFRQTTAESWFSSYTSFVLLVASQLYVHKKEYAFDYILANTAYYLNKSQLFKYDKRPQESMNDAIGRILLNFENINYTQEKNSFNNPQFFKEL